MNLPQRVVLSVGFLLIALSFAFPWSRYTFESTTRVVGWESKLFQPTYESTTAPVFFATEKDSKRIHYSWVAMQVLALGALTASAYFVAGYWTNCRSFSRRDRMNAQTPLEQSDPERKKLSKV